MFMDSAEVFIVDFNTAEFHALELCRGMVKIKHKIALSAQHISIAQQSDCFVFYT